MTTQIRDARIKVTVDTEEAKRDIDLLRKSIGKESKKVNQVSKKQTETQEKADEFVKGAQKGARKVRRVANAMGYRGMRVPDMYGASIAAAASASALLVNWIPIAGPPLGSVFRTITRTALPFAEFGGSFTSELLKTGADAFSDTIEKQWDKIPDMLKPDMPHGFKMGSDLAVMMIAKQIKELGAKMTEVRIWQANLEMMIQNVGSIMKTELAVGPDNGMNLSSDFLRSALDVEWKVANAQNSFRMAMEKTVRGKMGSNLGKTISDYIKQNPQRGQ